MPVPTARLVILTLSVAPVLVACGSTVAGPPSASPIATSPSATGQVDADGAGELVAYGMVMQAAPGEHVELCANGFIATSDPPQCGGPQLLGDFSWEDVDAEQANGVRWTDSGYFAVGYFDREADTFTLTRSLSIEPPDDFVMPSPEDDAPFPQLCDDPHLGASDPATAGPAEHSQAQELLDGMPGYVRAWVSDEGSTLNVIVTGDPEAASLRVRETWQGGLCVEQRDVPDAASIAASQQALGDRRDELALASSSGGRADGLHVVVLHADEDTVAMVQEIVAPWIEPEHVHVTGTMVPLASTPSG